MYYISSVLQAQSEAIPDEDTTTETRNDDTVDETLNTDGNHSDDETSCKELSDGENGGMKQEVTSTCTIPDEGNNDYSKNSST